MCNTNTEENTHLFITYSALWDRVPPNFDLHEWLLQWFSSTDSLAQQVLRNVCGTTSIKHSLMKGAQFYPFMVEASTAPLTNNTTKQT